MIQHPSLRSTGGVAWLAALILSLASTAHAVPSTDFSFFDLSPGGVDAQLDFDELPHAHGDQLTNEYLAGFGVSFGPNVWFENTRSNLGFDTHNIANFITGSTSGANVVTDFVFSGNVDAVALEWTANTGSNFQLDALLGGNVVETRSFTSGQCCAAVVIGFEGVEFDTFRITALDPDFTNQIFIADLLTFSPVDTNPVPEPSTAALCMLGLAGLAIGTPRRRPANAEA